jgi:hypothetical protein
MVLPMNGSVDPDGRLVGFIEIDRTTPAERAAAFQAKLAACQNRWGPSVAQRASMDDRQAFAQIQDPYEAIAALTSLHQREASLGLEGVVDKARVRLDYEGQRRDARLQRIGEGVRYLTDTQTPPDPPMPPILEVMLGVAPRYRPEIYY